MESMCRISNPKVGAVLAHINIKYCYLGVP